MGCKSLNVFYRTRDRSVVYVYMVYHLDMLHCILFGCYIFVFLSFPEVHQEKLHEIFLEVLSLGNVFSIL